MLFLRGSAGLGDGVGSVRGFRSLGSTHDVFHHDRRRRNCRFVSIELRSMLRFKST